MKTDRATLLHETFRLGISLKGIDGVLETIGGILVWLVTPSFAKSIVQALFHHELAQGPGHFFTAHMLGASQYVAERKIFASAFLLSHGLTKVVLVIALWFNRLWAYPLMILVLVGFIAYQAHRFAYTHSVGLALLTVFDVVVVWLTWREYLEQRGIRNGRSQPSAASVSAGAAESKT